MNCSICLNEHAPEVGCSGTLVRPSLSPVLEEPRLPSDPDESLIGTTVGSFRIGRKLGRGGMGTVFLGEHAIIGSKVAVKVLHPHLASNPSQVSRFYAEARAVNLIGHENIVNIFDMSVIPPAGGDGPGRYYLIMEYLEGKALSTLTKGPADPKVAIPVLAQVCDALSAAHSHGVVHRDLKPENIFLVKRGRDERFVKILDFGIAKLFGAHSPGEQTGAGVIVGTPEYMAPEQTNGEAVDGRADLYSVGIIAYLLATGRLPFTTGGLTGILLAHRDTVPPPPSTVNPQVPQRWSDVILRALAKRPEDRYADAAQLREALESVLAAEPGLANGAAPTAGPGPSVQLLSTPKPLDSRHVSPFQVRVRTLGGQELGTLLSRDLSRGGVFLCTEAPLPALFERLQISLMAPEKELSCLAEVVRHVTAEQAQAWGMSPGFGVQFVELSPAFKEDLARLVAGLPLSLPAAPPRSETDDPSAEPTLLHYRKRINGDHYVMLAIPNDVEFSDIRARGREAMRELEALKAKRLSAAQLAQLDTALGRIKQALEVLGNPLARVEFDANRGNFQGVARCISAGITVTDLEGLRRRFLESHPANESKALVDFTTGSAFEANGPVGLALVEYEKALGQDPLNLRYQQRYWGLKKKVRTAAVGRED